MKIYIVFKDVEWEGSEVKGVFSTREKAEAFAPTVELLCADMSTVIEEWEVQ